MKIRLTWRYSTTSSRSSALDRRYWRTWRRQLGACSG